MAPSLRAGTPGPTPALGHRQLLCQAGVLVRNGGYTDARGVPGGRPTMHAQRRAQAPANGALAQELFGCLRLNQLGAPV